jgi:hypothetical protein
MSQQKDSSKLYSYARKLRHRWEMLFGSMSICSATRPGRHLAAPATILLRSAYRIGAVSSELPHSVEGTAKRLQQMSLFNRVAGQVVVVRGLGLCLHRGAPLGPFQESEQLVPDGGPLSPEVIHLRLSPNVP